MNTANSLARGEPARGLVASVGRVRPSPSEIQAAETIARDYIEGWYTGDAGRMDRARDENLVKRMPVHESTPEAVRLRPVSKARMVELTAAGGGENPDAEFEILVSTCRPTSPPRE